MKNQTYHKTCLILLSSIFLVPPVLLGDEPSNSAVGLGIKTDLFGSIYTESLVGGIEGAYRFDERWAVRGGVFFGSSTFSDFDFQEEYDFFFAPLFLDVHPFRGNFRLTGGVVFNNSTYTLTAEDPSFGRVVAEGSLPSIAPYAGLGWGMKNHSRRLSLNLDLGLIFTGSASVSVSGAGAGGRFEAEMEMIREDAEAIADDLKAYPLISLGLMYRF
jgi:hypothetical protein